MVLPCARTTHFHNIDKSLLFIQGFLNKIFMMSAKENLACTMPTTHLGEL